MSAFGFALALGLIAMAAAAILIGGIIWAERQPLDEPTEHGDGEE